MHFLRPHHLVVCFRHRHCPDQVCIILNYIHIPLSDFLRSLMSQLHRPARRASKFTISCLNISVLVFQPMLDSGLRERLAYRLAPHQPPLHLSLSLAA